MLLKVVLFAYSQGIVSSRGIEAACRDHVTLIALSGDSQPHFTTLDYQLRPYGYPRHGQLCEVAMQSGKTAIYRAKITKFWPGNEQKNWLFEFQGYMPNV